MTDDPPKRFVVGHIGGIRGGNVMRMAAAIMEASRAIADRAAQVEPPAEPKLSRQQRRAAERAARKRKR